MSHQQANQDPTGPAVHRITEARESHTSERDVRIRKYMISMSIRMACFVLAFFVEGWLRWAFLIAAIVLPYIAVVIANGGADLTKREPPAEFYKNPDPQALESPVAPTPENVDEIIIIDGTLFDPEADAQTTQTQAEDKNR